MRTPFARISDPAYAVLRVLAGAFFFSHGAQKIFGWFGGKIAETALHQTAGWIELIGGALIALGLFTVPAAFICSGQMAVAYFKAHAPQAFWPVENKGELAVIYCFLFLFIAAHGAGRWSLDHALGANKHGLPRRDEEGRDARNQRAA
jgi:putative oxidoreductase